MHLIVYTSQYSLTEDIIKHVLADIGRVSKRNNKQAGITGMLFYGQRRFLQVIEGNQSSLDSLMEKLVRDARHRDIKILIDEVVHQREFADWNMDIFDLTDAIDLEESLLVKFRDQYQTQFKPQARSFIQLLNFFLSSPEAAKTIISNQSA